MSFHLLKKIGSLLNLGGHDSDSGAELIQEGSNVISLSEKFENSLNDNLKTLSVDPVVDWISENIVDTLSNSFSGVVTSVTEGDWIETMISDLWTFGASHIVLDPIVDVILDYLDTDDIIEDVLDMILSRLGLRMTSTGILTHIGMFGDVGFGWNIPSEVRATWLNTYSAVQPLMWLSDTINIVMGFIGEALTLLVADLPHPLTLALPFYRLAKQVVSSEGVVVMPTCPDFSWTVAPWYFSLFKFQVFVRLHLPTWSTNVVPNSGTWYYYIGGVYDIGNNFSPPKTLTYEEIILGVALLVAVVVAVSTISKSGHGNIASKVLARAIDSASMSNLKTNFTKIKELIDDNKTLIQAIGTVAQAIQAIESISGGVQLQDILDEIDDQSIDPVLLNEIKSLCQVISSKVGIKLNFSS